MEEVAPHMNEPSFFWLAETAPTQVSGTEFSILTQYGTLGVFAVMLVIFARTAYKRETDRADRLEAEVLRLNTLLQEKAIPALASAATALEESQALVRDLQRERDREIDLRRIAESQHGQRRNSEQA